MNKLDSWERKKVALAASAKYLLIEPKSEMFDGASGSFWGWIGHTIYRVYV